MDDVPNINPVKPMWPTRPDERKPNKDRREQEDENGKQEQSQKDKDTTRKSDHDGQIDEYV
jgi:hypothetical protein